MKRKKWAERGLAVILALIMLFGQPLGEIAAADENQTDVYEAEEGFSQSESITESSPVEAVPVIFTDDSENSEESEGELFGDGQEAPMGEDSPEDACNEESTETDGLQADVTETEEPEAGEDDTSVKPVEIRFINGLKRDVYWYGLESPWISEIVKGLQIQVDYSDDTMEELTFGGSYVGDSQGNSFSAGIFMNGEYVYDSISQEGNYTLQVIWRDPYDTLGENYIESEPISFRLASPEELPAVSISENEDTRITMGQLSSWESGYARLVPSNSGRYSILCENVSCELSLSSGSSGEAGGLSGIGSEGGSVYFLEKGNSYYLTCRAYAEGAPEITVSYVKNTPEAGTTEEGLAYQLYTDDTGTMGVRITDYYGSRTELVIPDTIAGYPVYEIGESAFSGTRIQSIVLPSSLKSIRSYAFSDCSALTSIVLPEGIQEVYAGTFRNCTALESIAFPADLKTIGDRAFEYCGKLTDIQLPETLTDIGRSAFANCSSLESIQLPSGMSEIKSGSFESCYKLTEVILPDTMKSIGDRAFAQCTVLKEIPLPEGLEKIDNDVFSGCSSLTEIVLPDRVTSIGSSAFSGCSGLTEIILPDGVTSVGSGTFSGCSGLTEIILPDGVTSVGNSAFSGCSSLTKIILPDGVTDIGSGAFSNCGSLTEITLPDGVTSIGGSAFAECTALKEIEIPEGVAVLEYSLFSGCSGLENIVLPENLTCIKDSVFVGCYRLEGVKIPQSVSEIWDAYQFINYLESDTGSVPKQIILFVDPDSYAEGFAIENDLEYRYTVTTSGGTLTVQTDLENWTDYRGFGLTVTCGEAIVTRRTTDKKSYQFQGLPVGEKCEVTLTNTYGDEVGRIEDITIRETETVVSLGQLATMTEIQMKVRTQSSEDVTEQTGIEWYRTDGTLYAEGAALAGVPMGTELTCRIRLNKTLAMEYRNPADQICKASAFGKYQTVTLEPFSKARLTGVVRDEESVLAGASVTIIQKLNEKYEKRFIARTDADGKFQAEVFGEAADISVYAYGYRTESFTFEVLSSEQDLGEILLTPLEGAKISLQASYYEAVESGTEPQAEPWFSWEDISFSGSDLTTGEALGQLIVQENILIIPEGVNAGDTLRITADSYDKDFAAAEAEVTVDEKLTGSLELRLVQRGIIKASYESTENPEVCMVVYDAEGKRAAKDVFDNKEELLCERLQEGTYTVVLLAESESLVYPASLSGLAAAGFQENQDYVMQQVEVEDGFIAEAAFDSVPLLDMSRFSYLDLSQTQYTSNVSNTVVGKYFTLRAKAAFKEEYAQQVSDVKWIFEIPKGCSYVEGTLSSNGVFCTAADYGEDEITVSTEDPTALMRMCLMATEEGTLSSQCSLEFELDGRRIRQPVGSVEVKAGALTFDMCDRTMFTTVSASGTASTYADIYLYDNDVLAGQARANAAGNWSLDFELYKPYTYSQHKIYAEAVSVNGKTVRTQTRNLTYKYVENPVRVAKVTMINRIHGEEQITVFDYLNGSKGISYSYDPEDPIFTFLTEFDCEDISRLSDVRLDVLCSDGATVILEPSLDQKKGIWSVSGEFFDESIPVSVNVRYNLESAPVYSREELADTQETWAAMIKDFDEAQEEFENAEDVSLEGLASFSQEDLLDMEECLGKESCAELLASLQCLEDLDREYEEQMKKIARSYQELGQELKENNGKVEETENGYTIYNGTNISSVEYLSCDSVTPEQLLEEGYAEYDSTSGSPVYTKVDETSNTVSYVDFEQNTCFRMKNEEVSVLRSARADDSEDQERKFREWINEKLAWWGAFSYLAESTDAAVGVMAKSAKSALSDVTGFYLWLESDAKQAISTGNKERLQKIRNLQDKLVPKQSKAKNKYEQLLKTCKISGKALTMIQAADIPLKLNGMASLLDKCGDIRKIFWSCDNSAHISRGKWLMSKIILWLTKESMELTASMASFASKVAAPFTLGAGLGVGVAIDIVKGCGSMIFSDLVMSSIETGLTELQADCYFCDCVICDYERNKPKPKKKKPTPTYVDTGSVCIPIRDPAGYVYEAVASNRLEGVTATAYQKVTKYDIYGEPYEETELWEAEDYDQQNPLKTDKEGRYAWDVPEGKWQVKYEKSGYETGYSEWLVVPPPHFDVNVGLVSYEEPQVISAEAYPEGVELIFSKYMRTDNLESAISVLVNGTEIAGKVDFMDGEANPENEKEVFASRVRFVPEEKLPEDARITLRVSEAALSYAGMELKEDYSKELGIVPKPESLTATPDLEIAYNGLGEIEIEAQPAAAAAGRRVLISGQNSMLFTVEEDTVTLDENGRAAVHVRGSLPGQGQLGFTLENTALTAGTKVAVAEFKEKPVEELSVDGAGEVMEGKTLLLTAKFLPEDATNSVFRWSSSDPNVAKVDENGLVTGVKSGKASITVRTMDGTMEADCEITVKPAVIPVTGVTLDKSSLNLTKEGETAVLKAAVTPANATEKSLSWSSSNTRVAVVDAAGKVKAVSSGTANITVKTKNGGKTATCTVTVTIPVTGVKLNRTSLTLKKKGQSASLTATVSPSNAADKTVTWKSSNTRVVKISSGGVVKAAGYGTATVTATTRSGAKKVSCAVTVSANTIKVNRKTLNLTAGKSSALKATASSKKLRVKWKSSNKKVASVSSKGVVKAVGAGKATITCSVSDSKGPASAVCTVTVTPKNIKKLTAKAIKGGFSLQWTKDSKAGGYEIQYAADKKFKKNVKTVKIGSGRTYKKNITGLKKGTYYVRIRPYGKSGKTLLYGNYTKAVKAVVKK